MSTRRLALRFLIFLPLLIVSLGAQRPGDDSANNKEKKQPAIIAQYFYKFPACIQSVLTDSIVGVEVSFLSVDAGVMKPTTESATGFMVGDNTVLTSLHTFSDLPAVWPSALVRVYDGKDFFKVKMISANPSADLALLVIAEVEGGVKFTKKPIRFADYVDKKKMPGHFYTFAFSTVGKDVYFPIKLGGYLMETNLIGNEVFPEPFGVVGGNVEKGFSGAPLIGSDGKVYGVVNRGSGAYVYVSTLEQIGSFLKESAERFNEGMAQKLLEKEKK